MDVLDTIVTHYTAALNGWQAAGISIARHLFTLLALIQIVWAAILWMLNRNSPDGLLVEFVKIIMALMFFWTVLENAGVWLPAIFTGFMQAGATLSGGAAEVSPALLLKKGVELASTALENARNTALAVNISGALVSVFIALAMFLAFLRIAMEMIVTLIGGKIVILGGVIMLGFAGSRWTLQFAERYLSAAVTIGIKLFFLVLIVSVGESLSGNWAALLNAEDVAGHLSVLGASLVYMFVVVRVPELAASLLGGSFVTSLGGSFSAAAASFAGSAAANAAGVTLAAGHAVRQGALAATAAEGGMLTKAGAGGLVTAKSLIAGGADVIHGSVSRSAGGRMAHQIRSFGIANKP